jgi:hypothetical protein
MSSSGQYQFFNGRNAINCEGFSFQGVFYVEFGSERGAKTSTEKNKFGLRLNVPEIFLLLRFSISVVSDCQ